MSDLPLKGLKFEAECFDALRITLKEHLEDLLPERDHRERILNLIHGVKRQAAQTANAKLANTKPRLELRLVDVTKFDDESLYLRRHDGEGMQLRVTEEWWSKNF